MHVRTQVGRISFLGIKSFSTSLQSVIEFWYTHNIQSMSAELLPRLGISLQDRAFLSHSCKGMTLLGASLHG